MSIKEHPPHHVPVLLEASLELLNPQPGENYLDLTAGYGGHASAILSRTKNFRESCLVDRDEHAIAALTPFAEQGVRLIHDNFVDASRQLVADGRTFDLILVDLGVSSPQLDISSRGFSFTHQGPLDMRMDQRQALDAREYINTAPVDELADTIHRYGEESKGTAKRYAVAIAKARPLDSTDDLARVIQASHVGRWQKTHPATRTFQAIRIRVNDELGQVERLMPMLPQLLSQAGRVGVISFHSLEDRIVKRYFAEQAASGYESELAVMTKKPRSGLEDVHNPRARSAQLRVAYKK